MNRTLNFYHRIPILVFHDKEDVSVLIKINDTVVFDQKFTKNIEHSVVVDFYHEYEESTKNVIEFEFNGTVESSNRYLQIDSLEINSVYINLYNFNYKPKLDESWWNSLRGKRKEKYLDLIHGIGNRFGWFGNIKYNFYCGFDLKSRLNTDADKDEKLLGQSADWVFLDTKSNTTCAGKLKRYGKLL